jgi:hypothetical protein
MRFGEPHPYPERGSHTDGASRGNNVRKREPVYYERLFANKSSDLVSLSLVNYLFYHSHFTNQG